MRNLTCLASKQATVILTFDISAAFLSVVEYIYNALRGYRLNKICERITYLMCYIYNNSIKKSITGFHTFVLVSVLNYVINSLP